MQVEKVYELNGNKIVVVFEESLIRIKSPLALQEFLSKHLITRTEVLVNQLKMDYSLLFDKELSISNDSIAVEIWGHVYASYFAKLMKSTLKIGLISKFADFINKRSDTIDCGETPIDENRKFWDTLVHFKRLMIVFLPKRLK